VISEHSKDNSHVDMYVNCPKGPNKLIYNLNDPSRPEIELNLDDIQPTFKPIMPTNFDDPEILLYMNSLT
jgi:hypothetical protein